MGKIKLTKGELKRQRDSLKQYQRYLPTLQLKKQQLQLEILQQVNLREHQEHLLALKKKSLQPWCGLLAEPGIDLRPYLRQRKVATSIKNIAGADIPVFKHCDFAAAEYDLFLMPLWVDAAIDALRAMLALEEEIRTIEQAISILRRELRITSQRVNLFEKVKIPEAQEAIRQIKIYIGDQMANAVGRSKIAKAKIEEAFLSEVAR
jgi:V/A-type H+-transporting ATPase subunit D